MFPSKNMERAGYKCHPKNFRSWRNTRKYVVPVYIADPLVLSLVMYEQLIKTGLVLLLLPFSTVLVFTLYIWVLNFVPI